MTSPNIESIDKRHWVDTLVALKSIEEGKTITSSEVFTWVESWDTHNELPKPVG